MNTVLSELEKKIKELEKGVVKNKKKSVGKADSGQPFKPKITGKQLSVFIWSWL